MVPLLQHIPQACVITGKSSSENPATGDGEGHSGIISFSRSIWQMKKLKVGVACRASHCWSLAELKMEPRCPGPRPWFFPPTKRPQDLRFLKSPLSNGNQKEHRLWGQTLGLNWLIPALPTLAVRLGATPYANLCLSFLSSKVEISMTYSCLL